MGTCTNQIPKSSSSETRRSANYKSNIWEYDLVQSLTTNYSNDEEIHTRMKENLKDQVMVHLLNISDQEMVVSLLSQIHAQLEMIDDLERLGLKHLFEKEIKLALDRFYAFHNNENVNVVDDLYSVALSFRLLRQHGYIVSQDVFIKFMDQQGNFIINDSKDIKEILSLFEASFLAIEGEYILDEAKACTSKYLKRYYNKGDGAVGNKMLMKQVEHALELPRHMRMLRLESRWYIDEYAKKETINHALLELAKLEFNVVQSTHQQDLKQMSKWWKDLKLVEKLSFARDRVVECFLASVGITFEPQLAYSRRGITKVCTLITTIDDVYDIYGTLEEVEHFTSVVERWNIDEIAQLPTYLKICFLALYNTVNEFAYVTLMDNGFDILTNLKKAWTDLCKSFLVEARWYHNGYIPTFEEYINNGWISSGGPVILLHAYIFSENENIKVNALNFFGTKPNLIRWSSIVLRLTNDLETSSAEVRRGDISKSIQCYMHQNGVSEEVARVYIKHLLDDTWKKMNNELYGTSSNMVTCSFRNISLNLGRMAHCMFQNGDGYGIPDGNTKDIIVALLTQPIILTKYKTERE